MYFVEQCGFTPFRKQYLAKMMPLVATWRHLGYSKPLGMAYNPLVVMQEWLSKDWPSFIKNGTFWAEQCGFAPGSNIWLT